MFTSDADSLDVVLVTRNIVLRKDVAAILVGRVSKDAEEDTALNGLDEPFGRRSLNQPGIIS